MVLSKPPVANSYASKLKEKQVANVFQMADGSYKGGKTPPEKKGKGKGGKGGCPKGSKIRNATKLEEIERGLSTQSQPRAN